MRLSRRQVQLHDDQRDLGEEGARAHAALLAQVFRGTVLDAGGGTGRVSVVLRAVGASPLLLDLSADMLAAAPRSVPRVRADLTALPLPDGSIDGVHAAYAIQNVLQWRTAVRELVRVLRPGGALLVAWGSGRPDPLVLRVREHYMAQVAPWAGVAAERTGLRSTDEADRALEQAGCSLIGTPTVNGSQIRTVRQLVERTAGNPFQSNPPESVRRSAIDSTLHWASDWCDVDAPQHVLIAHEYRHYYRLRPQELPTTRATHAATRSSPTPGGAR